MTKQGFITKGILKPTTVVQVFAWWRRCSCTVEGLVTGKTNLTSNLSLLSGWGYKRKDSYYHYYYCYSI